MIVIFSGIAILHLFIKLERREETCLMQDFVFTSRISLLDLDHIIPKPNVFKVYSAENYQVFIRYLSLHYIHEFIYVNNILQIHSCKLFLCSLIFSCFTSSLSTRIFLKRTRKRSIDHIICQVQNICIALLWVELVEVSRSVQYLIIKPQRHHILTQSQSIVFRSKVTTI